MKEKWNEKEIKYYNLNKGCILRKLFLYLLVSMLLIPVGLQAKYRFEETVHVPLPHLYLSKWEVGYQNINKAGTVVTRYFLNTESKNNWTQIINIQFKDKVHLKGANVEKAMEQEALKSSWVTSKIHSQTEDECIYVRDFPTGEHEIVRMIMTEKGLHRVAYIKRGPLSKDERAQWIERLAQGKVGGKL